MSRKDHQLAVGTADLLEPVDGPLRSHHAVLVTLDDQQWRGHPMCRAMHLTKRLLYDEKPASGDTALNQLVLSSQVQVLWIGRQIGGSDPSANSKR